MVAARFRRQEDNDREGVRTEPDDHNIHLLVGQREGHAEAEALLQGLEGQRRPDHAQKGTDGYEFSHFEHFMESFALNLGATLSFTLQNPSEDLHTNLETMFKSLGMALDQATTIDPRRKGQVPSTKGIID